MVALISIFKKSRQTTVIWCRFTLWGASSFFFKIGAGPGRADTGDKQIMGPTVSNLTDQT